MNYNRYSRLFIDQDFLGHDTILSSEHAHYLTNVMRKKVKDHVLIFNGREGEFLAQIIAHVKNTIELKIISKTREQIIEPKLTLIFSVIKHSRLDYVIEKGTELGVTQFIPVITCHSVCDKLNISKAQAWIISACEQSGRLFVPIIQEPINLRELISGWDGNKPILFANEAENITSLNKLALNVDLHKDHSLLIGPEGGFSNEEKALLCSLPFVQSFHLGPFILRAETAAVCAISCVKLLLNHLAGRSL
jgi:16S rRNA (uracil1498-N3)-methyltransferase